MASPPFFFFFSLLLLFPSIKSHLMHHNHTPLSHLYNNSAALDDRHVTFFWTLSNDSISFAARSEKRSNYLAIGFGDSMVNSYAYVGWIASNSKCHVSSYWISGRDAASVHMTSENLTHVRCRSDNGIISFHLTRQLVPSCTGRIECENVIDPMKPLNVIWALGNHWSEKQLSEKSMHFAMSDRSEPVFLLSGLAEAERDLGFVLAVHGFLMFVSWGALLPGGILSARFLKHIKGDDRWFKLHVYLQYCGLVIALIAVTVATAGLGGFFLSSSHVKFGLIAVILGILQPINGFFRPMKSTGGEIGSRKRFIWEYTHVIIGRIAIIVGVIALFTGLKHFADEHDSELAERFTWALVLWILICVSVVIYMEYIELKRRRRENNFSGRNWELGDFDVQELEDLLHEDEAVSRSHSDSFVSTSD